MRLERLAALARQYYEEFVDALGDWREGRERIYAVERLAQLLAQSILDYAVVLAARRRGAKPSSYRELASFLARQLGLGGEEAEFLEGLAGFRNILVHMYADVDRRLEEEAFSEIERIAPRVIKRLEEHAQGDPCLEDVRGKLVDAARRLGLRYVVVFGSIARSGCGGDVDLLVKLGRRPRSLLEVGRVRALLEETLGVEVDLVVLEAGVDPGLAKTIVDEGVLVYGDPHEAEEDMLRLYKEALDYRFLLGKLSLERARGPGRQPRTESPHPGGSA